MLTSIKTGNAITTALVISMFIYLFVKLNIKFMIRQFTIIVFTIFTPVAVALWIINRNVTAMMIWSGQIIMNIFMQFIYCFLFLIYLNFLPSSSGWLISLIWAMMILPLADSLLNCLQDLTSRIAGVDSEQMAGRGIGMGAALGYSIGAIKEQFNTNNVNNQNTNTSSTENSGFSGIINNAKSIINPRMNLSNNEGTMKNNPIRDNNKKPDSVPLSKKDIALKVANVTYKGTKTYLGIGSKMAEGNWNDVQNRKNNLKEQIIPKPNYDIGDEDD